jgi:hypothetical protein
MDPTLVPALAQAAVTLIAPHLPDLLKKAGEGAVGEVGKRSAAAALDYAKLIWSHLAPKIDSDPAAKKATERAADSPQDARALTALELELEDLFRNDDTLAATISTLLEYV